MIDWFLKIALALNKMHKLNVFHLDIKPENVMMLNEFQPRLIDLGNSMQREEARFSKLFVGTKKFVGPRVYSNKKIEYNYYVDTYAFTVMMFELVTEDEEKEFVKSNETY